MSHFKFKKTLRIEDICAATPPIYTIFYVKLNIFNSPYSLFLTFFQTFCIFFDHFAIILDFFRSLQTNLKIFWIISM